jgi:type II secretory pathway predicted ATPase ExeA
MNQEQNPFSPGAGAPPPELTGREEILEQAKLALARIKRGKAEKSIFLVGLRGVGKTVLLNRIDELAKNNQHHSVIIEANENKSLPLILLPVLRKILFSLDNKHLFRVFKSFLSTIKSVNIGDVLELTINVEPEKGTADSGDLEADLTDLFVALAEAAKARQTAIAIIIDELQYVKEKELSALIMAIHKTTQKALPLIILGAGLPQLVGQAGKAKSYAERLFSYPEIGALNKEDAQRALQQPVEREGASFTSEALTEIFQLTQGYPYFLQEWGYHAWNLASTKIIELDTIKKATEVALKKLDENFFRVRFDRLTPKEKQYLRALAELGQEPQRSGTIAEKLRKKVNQTAPLRNSLIKKGMIYSPTHGDTAFTVPLFGDFLKRTMNG